MSEWIKTAKVGDKVQCVNTWSLTDGLGRGDEIGPVAGEIYTIREIGFLYPPMPETLCVRLCEIKNPERMYFHPRCGFSENWESAFGAFRFRPIRPTNISIFTDMLKTAPAPIEETV